MAIFQHSSGLKFPDFRKYRLISMFTQNVIRFYLQTVQIEFIMAVYRRLITNKGIYNLTRISNSFFLHVNDDGGKTC